MSETDVRSEFATDADAEELYEDAPCGYLSTAPDGTILRANRTFLAWTGYEPGALVGQRRFYDLLPAGAKIYYETHYAPLLEMQGAVRELALELVRADGSRLPVLVNAVLKRDDGGRALLVRITVFDASDRRRYERELLQARIQAEARATAASALEHVAEGVVLVDEDGRVRLANPAAERIFGVFGDDVRGLPITAVAPGWNELAPRIPLVRADEPPPPPAILPVDLGRGTRWLAVSASPAPEGVVFTFRDVTDERRLEDLRDDIVAVVSHELRTPVASVYGAATTLRSLEGRLDDEQRRELVDAISEQSGRLARIVEQIALTRRIDAGDVAVERRTFDVADVVARVVAATRTWRESRPVAADVPSLEAAGDPSLFEQVLTNLLDNAIKHSPPNGVVRVAAERVRASVHVTVSDEGPGIPPDAQERIFEKFFRTDPDQESGTAGIGLGLYISRELVRRMNGRLRVVPSDVGATFLVELPPGA